MKKNQFLGHFSELYVYVDKYEVKIEQISNYRVRIRIFFYNVIFQTSRILHII